MDKFKDRRRIKHLILVEWLRSRSRTSTDVNQIHAYDMAAHYVRAAFSEEIEAEHKINMRDNIIKYEI